MTDLESAEHLRKQIRFSTDPAYIINLMKHYARQHNVRVLLEGTGDLIAVRAEMK